MNYASSNVTDDNSYRYAWDGENRLKSVESRTLVENSFRHEFRYDYMGRRIEKKVLKYQSGAWVDNGTTRYVWDGWNMIQELNGSNAVVRQYVWGPDLSGALQGAGGVGGLLAMQDGSNTYYYTYDSNGNVSELIKKSDSSVAAHYEYDPYGNTVYSSGAMKDVNPFRFSTKYRDGTTQLYYYGYRYYNNTLGRWLNRDPIEEKGGLNLYGFVGNNGVNGVDPKGQAIYTGEVLYASGGFIIGGGFLTGVMKTDCECGKYYTGELQAWFYGYSVGIPVSAVQFTLAVEDNLSGIGDLSSMSGESRLTCISGAFLYGGAISNIELGNATSTGAFGPGAVADDQWGVDLSADLFEGWARIVNIKEKSCE